MTEITTLDFETIAKSRHYLLVTDGACVPNPGNGGWAAILQLKDGDKVLHQRAIVGHGTEQTTNNRMEMTAVLMGLGKPKEIDVPIIVTSDSKLIVDAMTLGWIENWKAKLWADGGKPRLNADLWQQIDKAREGRKVYWQWVKGHAGHPLNELVDTLAGNAAAMRYRGKGKTVIDQHPELFF
jgi:ribonuclease HI